MQCWRYAAFSQRTISVNVPYGVYISNLFYQEGWHNLTEYLECLKGVTEQHSSSSKMFMQRVFNVLSQNSNIPIAVDRSKPKTLSNGRSLMCIYIFFNVELSWRLLTNFGYRMWARLFVIVVVIDVCLHSCLYFRKLFFSVISFVGGKGYVVSCECIASALMVDVFLFSIICKCFCFVFENRWFCNVLIAHLCKSWFFFFQSRLLLFFEC